MAASTNNKSIRKILLDIAREEKIHAEESQVPLPKAMVVPSVGTTIKL